MDFQALLMMYRNSINADYSYSYNDLTYRVTRNGVIEGSIQGNYITHAKGDIKLFLPAAITENSTIDFLLNIIEDQYTINSFSKTLKGVISGRLSLDNPNYYETLTVLIDKRLAFLSIPEKDIDSVLPFFDAFFENYYYLKERSGLLLFIESNQIDVELDNLLSSIESELFMDLRCIYSDKLYDLHKIKNISVELKNSLELSKKFNIHQKVIPIAKLLPYQVITSTPSNIRQHLLERIFSDEFQSALDEEMIMTIDALFEHDLNLTDTAKNLFIHRNTLLYRIEKIYKLTGFDLKKFSDSFIFNIAWIMRKVEH